MITFQTDPYMPLTPITPDARTFPTKSDPAPHAALGNILQAPAQFHITKEFANSQAPADHIHVAETRRSENFPFFPA